MTKDVLPEDVNDATLRRVCEVHGTGWLIDLMALAGGQKKYIPMLKTVESISRNREIRESHKPIRELANEHNLTITRVKQIILGDSSD